MNRRLPGNSDYLRWFWLGCVLFGVAVWTGVGFAIRALIAAL